MTMKSATRQKLIGLYKNWCSQGRSDFGLPFSLGDLLIQVRKIRGFEKAQSESLLTAMAEANSLPLSFVQELDRAVGEGVSDEEVKDLCKAQTEAKHPAPAPEK
jgi:hypothetical protein